MPLTSARLPNLMNGVSQQAVNMRLPSQAEVQVNAMSSIVEGTGKRPPLKHVAKLIDGQVGNVFTHTINRDTSERYTVVVSDESLKVFDLEGGEKTVTYPDGTAYLASADPKADFRAVTVADHTFIVNTSVTVAEGTTLSPKRTRALVFIKAVAYGVTYKVTVDGTEVASYKTEEADVATVAPTVEEVVTNLHTQMVANLPTHYWLLKSGPVIDIVKATDSEFELEVSDDRANTLSAAILQKVQRFTDLPTVAHRDFTVEIYGDEGTAFDNYYLKFTPDNASVAIGEGIWQESVEGGIEVSLDPATMPHLLVRQPDGSFEVTQATWDERIVGDLESSPWPTFVGKTIEDIFYTHNRMCFLSAASVIMSGWGEYFRFFPATVTSILDDGPIDVAAAHTKVSLLRHAVPFNGSLLLFSDQTQFQLKEEKLLASKPPTLPVLTEYECSTKAKPIGVGNSVYFTNDRGKYASVSEFYVVPNLETADPADVTKHVPKYIPSGVSKMAATSNEDVMVLLTDNAPAKAYVYKFYWQGDQKLQSSWSEWDFPPGAQVVNVDFIGSICYFTVQYADAVYLESMDMTEGQIDEGEDFVYRLDRRVSEVDVSMSYSSSTDQTTLTLPYQPSSTVKVVTRNSESAPTPAAVALNVMSVTGADVVVKGDCTGKQFYVGETYSFKYKFSEPVIKTETSGGAKASLAAGNLIISNWHITYSETGFMKVSVCPRNNCSPSIYKVTGKRLSDGSAKVGAVSVADGTLSFPVKGRSKQISIEVESDNFLPCFITGAEWEGRYERHTSSI